jgi:hypothetical protein
MKTLNEGRDRTMPWQTIREDLLMLLKVALIACLAAMLTLWLTDAEGQGRCCAVKGAPTTCQPC